MQRTLTAKQIPPNPVGSWLDDRRDKADSATITTSKYRKKKKNLKTVKFQWKSWQIYYGAPHISARRKR